MLTSGSQRSAADEFLLVGFCAFMMKPLVRPSHLLEALRQGSGRAAARAVVVAKASVSPQASSRARRSAPSSAAEFSGVRVLVAEDNVVNQRLVRHLLGKLGCRVDMAGNGREAVALASRLHYDVIFMDCLMPELDGYAATGALCASERGRARVVRR